VVDTPAPGTPKWWLNRLENELSYRTPAMTGFRQLVDDDHPLPESQETSIRFARMAGLATTNLTGLAVEATAERMSIQGVRVGDEPDNDKVVWDMWQRSDFDAGSQEAITAALVYSRSFVSVEPPTGTSDLAQLHYEDPRQVVQAYLPNGQRGPALKVFTDEWTGDTFGTLYTNDVIVKMVRKATQGIGAPIRWMARDIGREDPVVRNPLGQSPFFELQNKLTGSIRSEVAPLVIPQRRLNQLVFNTDAVAEYGAFRQKWVTGIEVPRDPQTGLPVAPYSASLTNLFVAEEDTVRFGDFNPTDPSGYIELGREIAAHMSRLSRVPITYFLSNISNLGGDALALLISGLVLKCQRRVKGYEPGLEGAVRLALATMNDPRANAANVDIDWAEMETRSMAQSADAAVKLATGDNPVITPQTAQEKYLGMSQSDRDRDDAWRLQGRASSNLDALLSAADASPLP
jgi:hypothetical protein